MTAELKLEDFAPELRAALEYRLQCWEEDEASGAHEEGEIFDVRDALHQIAQEIDERLDGPRTGPYRYSAAVRRQVAEVLIRLGCLTPISEEQARESVRCGIGGKLGDFAKHDGQRYEFVGWEPLLGGGR